MRKPEWILGRNDIREIELEDIYRTSYVCRETYERGCYQDKVKGSDYGPIPDFVSTKK